METQVSWYERGSWHTGALIIDGVDVQGLRRSAVRDVCLGKGLDVEPGASKFSMLQILLPKADGTWL